MYIWLSLWTGTGPSVHVPDTKALSARADTSQPGYPQHRTPMFHCQSGETLGSWRSSPFCPNKRGGARKTSSANLLFKQFLNKIFWVCKTQELLTKLKASKELKFKMPSEPAGGCRPSIPSCLCTEEITLTVKQKPWRQGLLGQLFSPCLPGGSASSSHPDFRCSLPLHRHTKTQDTN